MSDKLDELVAVRVMGWCVINGSAKSPEGHKYDATSKWETGRPRWIPYYSNCADEAHEIIDHLRRKCILVALEQWPDGTWIVKFFGHNDGSVLAAKSNNFCIAVCLAALGIVGTPKDEIDEVMSGLD